MSSELICIAFAGTDTADRVLNQLYRLEKEHLIDLEDAVVVQRDGRGRLRIRQSVDLVGMGAISSGTWGALFGTLIGTLFLNPLIGLVAGGLTGAGLGALSGSLVDYGINDDFVREVGESLEKDGSALFILVREAKPDRVIEELGPFEGRLLRTSLAREDEARLRQMLAAHTATAADHASQPQAAGTATTGDVVAPGR